MCPGNECLFMTIFLWDLLLSTPIPEDLSVPIQSLLQYLKYNTIAFPNYRIYPKYWNRQKPTLNLPMYWDRYHRPLQTV